jgi:hypothetical protein
VRRDRIEIERREVHVGETRGHSGRRGDHAVLILVELPQPGQSAERYVELAAGPLAHLVRDGEDLEHFGAHRHWRLAAAAFRRVMSLPSFHTLISRSSRSNSAKTASNAAAAGSFVARPGGELQQRAHRHALVASR